MLLEFYKSVLIFVFVATLSADAFAFYGDTKKCLRRDGKFPIPGSSCVSYYICKNWHPIREENCPEDQHFNANKEFCDWKDLYPCLEKPKTKECPRPNGKFLKPGSECRKYFDCCDGKPKEKHCPNSLLFDQERGECDYRELVICKEISESKKCPFPNGRFVKPNSKCRIFIDCRNGKPTERNCPEYQLFDEERQLCDYEELVTCKPDDVSKESSSEESHETDGYRESTITTVSESTQDKISSRWSTKDYYSSTSDISSFSDIVIESTTEQNNKLTSEDIYSSQQPKELTSISTTEGSFSSGQTREPIPVSTPEEIFTGGQTKEPIPVSTPEEFSTSGQTREPISISTSEEIFTGGQTKEPIPVSTPEEFSTSGQTREPIPVSTPEEVFTGGQTREPIPIYTSENELSSPQTEQPTSFKTFSETTIEVIASDSTSETETETSFDFDNFICPEPTGYFPHPTDKTKFIGCVHDKPYIMDCPSDLIYNDKYKRCLHQ